MKKRRKQTIHTLDSMSVLDIAHGLKDKDGDGGEVGGAENDKDFG